MSEFVLGGMHLPAFKSLDEFTQGYIQGLFFTNEDIGVATFADLHPKALAKIVLDCATFQENNKALLERAYERDGYDAERAGTDFWYCREGHGTGYWDRDMLEADGLGDALSEQARRAGQCHVYFGGDDKVHV